MKLQTTPEQQTALQLYADSIFNLDPLLSDNPKAFKDRLFHAAKTMRVKPPREMEAIFNMTKANYEEDRRDILAQFGFEIRDEQIVRVIKDPLSTEDRAASIAAAKKAMDLIHIALRDVDASSYTYGILATFSALKLHGSATHRDVEKWQANGYPASVVDLYAELGYAIENDRIVKIENVPA